VRPNQSSPRTWCNAHSWALPLGIALIGLGLNIVVACSMGLTTDEGAHLAYGDAILRGTPDRTSLYFNSKMPVTALNSFPRMLGSLLRNHGLAPRLLPLLTDLRTARMATVAAAFCLCLLVYFYAASLYGRTAGLFAQLLFVISPNIIAHSTIVTTDLYIALGAIGFLYCLRRFLLNPGAANALLVAAILGLAQLTKFTAVYLYFVLIVVVASCALFSRFNGRSAYSLPGKQVAILLGLNILCFLVCVNIGFVFDRTFTPLSRYKFISPSFQAMQQVPLLRDLPLPVPYPYLQGLDMTGYENVHASTFGNLVLLGQVHGEELAQSGGFPAYYLVAYGLKEPLGMQMLLALGLAWIVWRRNLAEFLLAEWPLLATAVLLLIVFSFFSNTQIGIRHILPVLVIFVVLSGAAFAEFGKSPIWRKALLATCLLYVAISAGTYFPRMIPYFNEIVLDRKMAYRFLADSNLDWSQDRDEVAVFLKKNPNVALDPPEPVTGWVLVRANLLAGVIPKKADYWLRARSLTPVGHVAYAHLLFFIPP
jgi:4-amino-4-deoxy-L-arabinose transferase-like glycosyltransferase